MNYLSKTFIPFFVVLLFVHSNAIGGSKGNPNSIKKERKDDAKVEDQRQDVNEAAKKIETDLKEVRDAELAEKKSYEAVTEASKAKQVTSDRIERMLGERLGIATANEAQRTAQNAYEKASAPLIEAMKHDPKHAGAFSNAQRAELLLQSLALDTKIDDETRRQEQAVASKEMADWRVTVNSHLSSQTELEPWKERLVLAQKRVAELRSMLSQQLDIHPELKASERERQRAKETHERDTQRVSAVRRKVASDQSKLMAE